MSLTHTLPPTHPPCACACACACDCDWLMLMLVSYVWTSLCVRFHNRQFIGKTLQIKV